jgi:hypothetical protein
MNAEASLSQNERGSASPTFDRLDWPKSGFSVMTRRIVHAATQAILADEDDHGALIPASVKTCDRAVAAFDHSVGRSSANLRFGFAVLSLVLEWLPLFVIGSLSRMSRLPIERRLHYFEALEASRFGLLTMLLVAFKVPLAIPAFEEDEELVLTGFDRADTVARRQLSVIPVSAVVPSAAPKEPLPHTGLIAPKPDAEARP